MATVVTDLKLSVVLVVGDPLVRRGIERAIDSIIKQKAIDQMEILLVIVSPDDAPLPRGADHPRARIVRLPRETTTMAQARAAGVYAASAPIVTFMDEHSFAMAGWAEAVIEAHKGPWAGVGGEIYNLDSGRGVADPIYLMGHGRWSPPAPEGEITLLPSHDTSYKREILLSYGDDLPELLRAEPVLMWRLQQDGYRLYCEPGMKSLHGYTCNPLTLVAFYTWSRGLGAMRVKYLGMSRAKAILRFLLIPLMPFVKVARLLLYFVRERPDRLYTFIIGSPFILLAQFSAAIGEGVGGLFGMGNSEILFTQTHLRGLRLKPELPVEQGK